jgi:metal-dependent hydrolase (beta-lactamase superfamily II)
MTLAHNAQILGVPVGDLDAVVISDLHAHRVGGLRAIRQRAFTFSTGSLESSGVPAYELTQMGHPRGCDR